LKFGTRVRVTNLKNGKSVVVRINDRGPFIRGRIIDLAYGAATVVGLQKSGTAKVSVVVLD
jgi:rare lipoprotein A